MGPSDEERKDCRADHPDVWGDDLPEVRTARLDFRPRNWFFRLLDRLVGWGIDH